MNGKRKCKDLCHHLWIKFIFFPSPENSFSSSIYLLHKSFPTSSLTCTLPKHHSTMSPEFVRVLATNTKKECSEGMASCLLSSYSVLGLAFPLRLADSIYSTLQDRFRYPYFLQGHKDLVNDRTEIPKQTQEVGDYPKWLVHTGSWMEVSYFTSFYQLKNGFLYKVGFKLSTERTVRKWCWGNSAKWRHCIGHQPKINQ